MEVSEGKETKRTTSYKGQKNIEIDAAFGQALADTWNDIDVLAHFDMAKLNQLALEDKCPSCVVSNVYVLLVCAHVVHYVCAYMCICIDIQGCLPKKTSFQLAKVACHLGKSLIQKPPKHWPRCIAQLQPYTHVASLSVSCHRCCCCLRALSLLLFMFRL